MKESWCREEMLLGEAAVAALSQAHVAVFGLGGVGGYSVEALCRAGVGALTLIDSDVFSESNLNRQLGALHSTIGRSKAEVMAERVLDINPDCHVTALPFLYTEEDKQRFLSQEHQYDYIIDAIDLVSAKLSLITTARALEIPVVSSMGTGNKLDPTQFQITDIAKTSVCPLARVMRKELRARGIAHHMVLFSTELPRTPSAMEAPPPGRHSVPGSVSWVPSVAGLMLAGYVVQELAKQKM